MKKYDIMDNHYLGKLVYLFIISPFYIPQKIILYQLLVIPDNHDLGMVYSN